jgi:glycosyltransferase involved in cell wall biosynthesis
LQTAVGLPGRIEASLIRLEAFVEQAVERDPGQPVTVGRLSRDVPEKHDPQDMAVYRMLAARGVRVRIMGGMCLAPWLGGVEGIELLPAGAEPAPLFLRSLDIFYYRTGSFVEPYGRVVLEAMASGLPVVAAANGGFAEQIRHGEDALLVFTQQEALQALQWLVAQPQQRLALGSAARARALQLHGPQAIERLLAPYLDEPTGPGGT